MSADPLAAFADRDRATRDRIALVGHRSYTLPTPYPSHADYLTARVDALHDRYDLLHEMAHLPDTGAGVLWRLLIDAAGAAYQDLHEAEGRLAEQRQWEREQAQRQAYDTYLPNLRAVA